MKRPAIALVTGFTKSAELLERSLAPLRALKGKGVLDRVVAVTWDTPEIDPCVAPMAAMTDVELVRVPQPEASGTSNQRGLVYQVRNLEAALALVPEPHALIFKTRPDFVIDPALLEDKIANFETLCAPSKLHRRLRITMPASPFTMKLWVPWADANQPFFCEDAAFMGLRRDIAQLASRDAEKYLPVLADDACGWFAHVVRFVLPFLETYPVFAPYLANFRCFPNDLEYRLSTLPALLNDTFFLHLLIANAWILATSFHVDSGEQGQISFYTNTLNRNADWSDLESLVPNPPYDNIATWKNGQAPGGMMPCVGRAYGRLIDDSWQHSLFEGPALRDLTADQTRKVLDNVAGYRRGALASLEDEFVRGLSDLHRRFWQRRAT